jgi:hypothetical protein
MRVAIGDLDLRVAVREPTSRHKAGVRILEKIPGALDGRRKAEGHGDED